MKSRPIDLILILHSFSVDLWSVGVILYESLFGRAPFASESYQQLAEKIKKTKPIEMPASK